jgi:hypothetical protein
VDAGVQAMQALPEACIGAGSVELLDVVLVLGGHRDAGMDGREDRALCFSVEAVGEPREPLV